MAWRPRSWPRRSPRGATAVAGPGATAEPGASPAARVDPGEFLSAAMPVCPVSGGDSVGRGFGRAGGWLPAKPDGSGAVGPPVPGALSGGCDGAEPDVRAPSMPVPRGTAGNPAGGCADSRARSCSACSRWARARICACACACSCCSRWCSCQARCCWMCRSWAIGSRTARSGPSRSARSRAFVRSSPVGGGDVGSGARWRPGSGDGVGGRFAGWGTGGPWVAGRPARSEACRARCGS